MLLPGRRKSFIIDSLHSSLRPCPGPGTVQQRWQLNYRYPGRSFRSKGTGGGGGGGIDRQFFFWLWKIQDKGSRGDILRCRFFLGRDFTDFVRGGVWVSERERERSVDTNRGCNSRQLVARRWRPQAPVIERTSGEQISRRPAPTPGAKTTPLKENKKGHPSDEYQHSCQPGS